MNEVTTAEDNPVSAATLEHVLGTGDISKLTVPQRVEFYKATCRSLGLNPLTRPIRFLSFQGQTQAYFTRDGTDQLRKINKITMHVVDKHTDGDVYVITVRARTPDGREDEDIGAVTLGRLAGDSRANALMRCITKAKRRVTLSICGLGWTSEDELDTMPGAMVFDAEDTPPPVANAREDRIAPIRAAAAPMQRPARITEQAPANLGMTSIERQAAERAAAYEAQQPPQPERKSWSQWADSLELAVRDTQSNEELGRLIAKAEVAEIRRLAQEGPRTAAKDRIIAAVRSAEERYLADPPEPQEDDVVIAGAENAGAG